MLTPLTPSQLDVYSRDLYRSFPLNPPASILTFNDVPGALMDPDVNLLLQRGLSKGREPSTGFLPSRNTLVTKRTVT